MAVTVTDAVPLMVPLDAVTVNVPPVEPAVNSPVGLMEPPPLTDHLKLGCGFIGWPNWSSPVAKNCWVPPVWTEALDGETLMVVSVCVAPPHPGNRNELIQVLQLNVPFAFRYSFVYQNVQSSTGSTVMAL